MNDATVAARRDFKIKVLGRTLEHLGVQMYKRRDVALAELVANAWDAGATSVEISIPNGASYDRATSEIVVADDGCGMTADDVQDAYLVIGRNRRSQGQEPPRGRRVMGRKGVGKLAGFGIGRKMTVETWRDETSTIFTLDSAALKADDGEAAERHIQGEVSPKGLGISPSGSIIRLSDLKHKTPLDIDKLHQSLARRFGRAVVGEMLISINKEPLRSPDIELSQRWPVENEQCELLPDGNEIVWWAGFSTTVLPTELQGFTILVNGKTAQAPPFFFGVESSASGMHGTKYLTGVIEADYLDSGSDDESDRISTDRQEIDWHDEFTEPLREWGGRKTRELLIERVKAREKNTEDVIMKDRSLSDRVKRLDKESATRAKQFIRKLGWSEVEHEKLVDLADTIIRAFEYRQFHDYIEELERVSNEEPLELSKMVEHISGWKVLESRAILEVVRGRIEILETFHRMLTDDAPETAHQVGDDNLHDLIASFPWLINPEWQTFSEETTISKQLREWGDNDIAATDRSRYDFLALQSDAKYVVIEIKRPSHAATLKDLQQLESYVDKLGQSRRTVSGLFIAGGGYSMSPDVFESWKSRPLLSITQWSEVHERSRRFYEHYKAVLDGDVDADDFDRKKREVARARGVLDRGTFRGKEARRAGVGEQDVEYGE